MTWGEVSDDLTIWSLPAERTKNGIAHNVPLSTPARGLLKSFMRGDPGKRPTSGQLVFPGIAGTPFAGWSKAKAALDKAVMARRAEAAVTEARMTLAASDFSEASRLIEADDAPDAVPYLSRILATDPENSAVLTRLSILLTYHCWVIPTLRLNHGAPVHSAQFSPDDRRVVTASYDNTARVWDAQTGQPLTEPLRH